MKRNFRILTKQLLIFAIAVNYSVRCGFYHADYVIYESKYESRLSARRRIHHHGGEGCLNGKLMMTNDARMYASVYLLLFSRNKTMYCAFKLIVRMYLFRLKKFCAINIIEMFFVVRPASKYILNSLVCFAHEIVQNQKRTLFAVKLFHLWKSLLENYVRVPVEYRLVLVETVDYLFWSRLEHSIDVIDQTKKNKTESFRIPSARLPDK